MKSETCRFCGSTKISLVYDFGSIPLSNALMREPGGVVTKGELLLLGCESCGGSFIDTPMAQCDIFNEEYPYLSSVSDTWNDHCKSAVQTYISNFDLGADSHVLEIASNDGGVLKIFRDAGVSMVRGFEPSKIPHEIAVLHGLHSINEFFNIETSREYRAQYGLVDLVVANNVLAHVPDPRELLVAVSNVLAPGGRFVAEFPDSDLLFEDSRVDTIYHEHYSYLNVDSVAHMLSNCSLKLEGNETISTHGGSIRLIASKPLQNDMLCKTKVESGMSTSPWKSVESRRVAVSSYFDRALPKWKKLRASWRDQGFTVGGYGAAAKATSIINYFSIGADDIDFVADRSPSKIGMYIPSAGIPICSVEELSNRRPEIIIIFTWNILDEVLSALKFTREWGARYYVFEPNLEEVSP